MNENLDLTKILDGCPKGTKFYSLTFGWVRFAGVYLGCDYPICLDYLGGITNLTKKGTFNKNCDGECLLYPSKDQRDWSKFERFWDKPKIERFAIDTLKPYDKLIVRDDCDDYWKCDFFSYIDPLNTREYREYPIICIGNSYRECIPYNEETKHLVGATDDCPEYYKWWEK